MEVALLDLNKLKIDHSFFSFLIFLKLKYLSNAISPSYLGITELIWFHRFADGEEFFGGVNHSLSLILV